MLDDNNQIRGIKLSKDSPDLDDYAASQNAVIRVVTLDGEHDRDDDATRRISCPRATLSQDFNGFRIESRPIVEQSGRSTSSTRAGSPTCRRPRTGSASSSGSA